MWVEALEAAAPDDTEEGGELVELPTFTHRELTLKYPSSTNSLPKGVTNGPHWGGFFDGGAAKSVGTGGFVVFEPGGRCKAAHAEYYGEGTPTNNRAEAAALVGLMRWFQKHEELLGPLTPVVVFGDSKLLIDFCNRRARPSSIFYEALKEVLGIK